MKDDLIKRSDAIGAFVAETNGVDVEKAIKVVDAYLQIRECDEVWDSIRAIRDCLECAKDEIAEYIPSADGPQKVIAQITFDEEKLREIVKEAVERFKEEYEIADRPQGEWIPVKWHEITDEEREREGYPKDWVVHIDCEMPCDEQEILVQTKSGYVRWDVCYEDGEFSLDSGWDWIEDIVAWMPLPEPWKGSDDE